MTRICKLGRSYLYFNTRWHYFCRLQLSFHGYCEIILSMLVESQHTTGPWECNFFGSVIRKILINIEQMIIHRFVNSWARVIHGSHEQGLPRTLMISHYGRLFWEIQRKNHGYHEFDASVVASQLCHNCTVSWSEAHYSGTSDRPAELGPPSLATFPMQTWSND